MNVTKDEYDLICAHSKKGHPDCYEVFMAYMGHGEPRYDPGQAAVDSWNKAHPKHPVVSLQTLKDTNRTAYLKLVSGFLKWVHDHPDAAIELAYGKDCVYDQLTGHELGDGGG